MNKELLDGVGNVSAIMSQVVEFDRLIDTQGDYNSGEICWYNHTQVIEFDQVVLLLGQMFKLDLYCDYKCSLLDKVIVGVMDAVQIG